MAVHNCSGIGCKRNISISIDPGGNPVALDDYDSWSFLYATCPKCGQCFCDRCVKRTNQSTFGVKCPSCGGACDTPDVAKNIRITRMLAEQAWSDKSYGRVADIFELLPLFGAELTPAEEKKRDFSRKRVPDTSVPPQSSSKSDQSLFVERMATHRDRINQTSPAHRPFTADYFDDELLNTLAGMAVDKMRLSQADKSVHSISIAGSEAAYAIYTMPMDLAQAAQWFDGEYGGYMPFLNRFGEVPAMSSGNPELLVHLIFGQVPGDEDLWFAMTVLPMDQQLHNFQPLLATDLLTPSEMAELSHKMSSR